MYKRQYLEELREKRKDRDEYISEMSENSSSVVRAYTQAEYDNVDLDVYKRQHQACLPRRTDRKMR